MPFLRRLGVNFLFWKPISKWKNFDFSRFLVISERILPFSDRKSSRIFSWTQPNTRDFSQRTTMASFRNIYIDLGCRGFMSNLKNAIFDIYDLALKTENLSLWKTEKNQFFEIYFSAIILRILSSFVWYSYWVISGHLKISDFEKFWKKFRKILEIFQKFFHFFFRKKSLGMVSSEFLIALLVSILASTCDTLVKRA